MMDLQLKGKRALVTGSSIGIGKAIAQALAAEGAAVAVHGRDRKRADLVAHEITAAGGEAVVVLGDLTSDEDVSRLTEEAQGLLGGVDILVKQRRRVRRKAKLGEHSCEKLAGGL
jgi:3-oxoacyl-[acyl-carrier protein] reductase